VIFYIVHGVIKFQIKCPLDKEFLAILVLNNVLVY
jgi:hypothetical protein